MNKLSKTLDALNRLVTKIDQERSRGTPLIPKGHPDCEWDEDYPAELTNARNLLSSLGKEPSDFK